MRKMKIDGHIRCESAIRVSVVIIFVASVYLGCRYSYMRGVSETELNWQIDRARLALKVLMDARARGVTNEASFPVWEMILQKSLDGICIGGTSKITENSYYYEILLLIKKYRARYPFDIGIMNQVDSLSRLQTDDLDRISKYIKELPYDDEERIDKLFAKESRDLWQMKLWR